MSESTNTPFPYRIKVDGSRLTAIGEEKTGADRHWITLLVCRCDCGVVKKIPKSNVLLGNVRSCGCLASEVHAKRMAARAKHHLFGTRIYSVWSAMRHRCNNPKAQKWAEYGGRGIRVCQEWDASVEPFAAYVLSLVPAGTLDIPKGLQIDRHPNNDGHYEPGNIRFVPCVSNNRNRRNTRMITAFGATKPSGEWSDLRGRRFCTSSEEKAPSISP